MRILPASSPAIEPPTIIAFFIVSLSWAAAASFRNDWQRIARKRRGRQPSGTLDPEGTQSALMQGESMQYEPPTINFQPEKNLHRNYEREGPWGPGPRLALARECRASLRRPYARLAGSRDRRQVHAVGANPHQIGQSPARQAAGATLLIMAGMHGCALRPARCEL
jgi:hypothetical protein